MELVAISQSSSAVHTVQCGAVLVQPLRRTHTKLYVRRQPKCNQNVMGMSGSLTVRCWWGLMVAVMVHSTRGSDLPVFFHRGLEFRSLIKVLATSAQTVTFNFDLKTPPWVESSKLMETLQDLLLKQSPAQQDMIRNATATMNAAQSRITDHFEEIKFTTKLKEEKRNRLRRATTPIFNIASVLGWCCGFSTYDDVAMLEARDEDVLDSMQAIKSVVLDGQTVTRHNVRVVEQVVNQLNSVLPQLGKQISDTESKLNHQQTITTHIALLVAAIATQSTDKLLNAERMNSIRTACASGRVPLTAVPRKEMHKMVSNVNALHEGRARVAVDDVDTLYRLEIAKCVFSHNDEMTVIVKLPLIAVDSLYPSHTMWRAYDITPLGFLFQGQVCRLLPHSVLAVISEGSTGTLGVRLMSREQRALCLGRGICDVPRAAEDTGVAGECVRGIYSNRSLEALQRDCTFTCEPYRRVQLTHVEHNRYSVVNADRNLAVRCRSVAPIPSSSVKAMPVDDHLRLAPQSLGALFLEVPCQCGLYDGEEADAKVLVEPVGPCDPRLSGTVNVTWEVPSLWAPENKAFFELLTNQNATAGHGTAAPPLDFTIKVPMLLEPQPVDWLFTQQPVLASRLNSSWYSLPGWLMLAWLTTITVLLMFTYFKIRCIINKLGVIGLARL